MKARLALTVLLCALVAAWSLYVFLDVINGDIFWKKIASCAGFLFFAALLIFTVRAWLKSRKPSA